MAEMTIINIADLKKEPDVQITDLEGDVHVMNRATVGSFIENVERIEKLGVNASTKEEMDLMIEVICASFPTLTAENVKSWPLESLAAISDLARGQNAELVTTDPEKAAEATASGNDQPAT